MILVSRCLIGENCRYNGQSKPNQAVIDFLAELKPGQDYLLICPECAGRLPIPRAPGEISGGDAAAVWQGRAKVQNQAGDDYTPGFLAGAQAACDTARKAQACCALLKEKSPSCGVRQIHTGSFDGQLAPGQGVTAYALAQMGLRLFNENELPELKRFLAEN